MLEHDRRSVVGSIRDCPSWWACYSRVGQAPASAGALRSSAWLLAFVRVCSFVVEAFALAFVEAAILEHFDHRRVGVTVSVCDAEQCGGQVADAPLQALDSLLV